MAIMTPIPVGSIVIPDRFVTLCTHWHGGQGSMFYAVSSTGNLTIGTHPPRGCDTNEKWYLTLWRDLACDASYTAIAASNEDHDDYSVLQEFEDWCDVRVTRLEESYGLADWDPCDD